MRLTLLLSLLMLASCGSGKRSSFEMGKSTRADVVAQKGEPDQEIDLPVNNSKMMIYETSDEKYQLSGDIVTNAFKNPESDEKLLIHWQHRFKDCAVVSKTLPKDPKSHTPPEIEMSCPQEGISVIYTEGSEAVTRVVEYAKK